VSFERELWSANAHSWSYATTHAFALCAAGPRDTADSTWDMTSGSSALPQQHHRVVLDYDGAGRLTRREEGDVVDEALSDALGRVVVEKSADAFHARTSTYGSDGRLKSRLFGLGPVAEFMELTEYAYNEWGLPASVRTPDQRVLTRTYNARGLV